MFAGCVHGMMKVHAWDDVSVCRDDVMVIYCMLHNQRKSF